MGCLKFSFNDFIDWHLISPDSITPESDLLGNENKGNGHQLKKLLIVETNSH